MRKRSRMITRDRHKLSEVCTKCRKEELSYKTLVSLLISLVTSWLFRFNFYNGKVMDNIQLKTGHLVEHLTFDFLISSKRLQNEINGVVIKFNVFVSEFRPSTDLSLLRSLATMSLHTTCSCVQTKLCLRSS